MTTSTSPAFEFRASHNGCFPNTSPGIKHIDNKEHIHDWKGIADFVAEDVNEYGVVEDFNIIKKIENEFNDKYLNSILSFIPTTELLARWICWELGDKCVSVTLKEQEGRIAVYKKRKEHKDWYLKNKKDTYEKNNKR